MVSMLRVRWRSWSSPLDGRCAECRAHAGVATRELACLAQPRRSRSAQNRQAEGGGMDWTRMALLAAAFCGACTASARVLEVGPNKPYKHPSEAIAAAASGDV